ncbi:MAG: hypothetical protein M5U28_17810 [Sandaracinaceae bacterium]|nr:hypothetical protein [Sandaracinaceae bacterium]
MDGLIAFHVIALGVWAGIVAVELLYESAGFLGRLEPTTVAKLHLWTDRYLELPVLLLVVTSGLLLWQRAGVERGAGLEGRCRPRGGRLQPALRRPRGAPREDRR